MKNCSGRTKKSQYHLQEGSVLSCAPSTATSEVASKAEPESMHQAEQVSKILGEGGNLAKQKSTAQAPTSQQQQLWPENYPPGCYIHVV